MPHFFIFSIFSTATPRVVSSAVIDELLLLWCMLEPDTRDQSVKTLGHGEKQTGAKPPQKKEKKENQEEKPSTHLKQCCSQKSWTINFKTELCPPLTDHKTTINHAKASEGLIGKT